MKSGNKKRKAIASACLAAAFAFVGALAGCTAPRPLQSPFLADIYKAYFPIGAAVLNYHFESGKYDDLMDHFNSVTPENEMKWRYLEEQEGTFICPAADGIVEWAKEHDTRVRGHCLVWYKSLPAWIAEKGLDKGGALDLIDRHVQETVEYFGDGVYCWDVVNEALRNAPTQAQLDAGDYYRTGTGEIAGSGTFDWYALCGKEYIAQAFLSADEARKRCGAEEIKLYYNDYRLNDPVKREACVRMIEELLSAGVPVDGVGMQCHYRLPDYTKDKEGFMENFEASVKAFTALGVDVQVTELDISVYESNAAPPAFDGLPADVEAEQGELYGRIFEVCRRYSAPWKEGAGRVTGVTTWGVADDHTSYNTSSSVHTDYPLIFSMTHEYKEAYYEIIDFDEP